MVSTICIAWVYRPIAYQSWKQSAVNSSCSSIHDAIFVHSLYAIFLAFMLNYVLCFLQSSVCFPSKKDSITDLPLSVVISACNRKSFHASSKRVLFLSYNSFQANYPSFQRLLRGIVHIRAWRIQSIEFLNVDFKMADIADVERTLEVSFIISVHTVLHLHIAVSFTD